MTKNNKQTCKLMKATKEEKKKRKAWIGDKKWVRLESLNLKNPLIAVMTWL